MFKKLAQVMAFSLGLAHAASAAIVEKKVEYKSGDTTCEGVHIFDDANEQRRPGVLIVHQWTGISAHEIERAKRLAGLGYNVFIADIYGKGIRPQPPESAKEAGKYKSNRTLFRERLKSAMQVLASDTRTNNKELGAIGFCFGGTGVLELARDGNEVKGVVSFHGGLGTPTPEDAKNIKGKVLVLHGADDPHVPDDEVNAFKKEMADAKISYEFIAYPGAVHSFTQKSAGNDNSKGSAYNEAADVQSWEALRTFFKKIFNS